MSKSDPRLTDLPIPRLIRALRGSDDLSNGPIVIARAPGRLDVMGGIADYSGSTVCEMPLAEAAAVAVQRRDDGRIVCRSAQQDDDAAVDVGRLRANDPGAVRAIFSGNLTWARYPVGCAWWLMRHAGADAAGGVTIVLDSDVPLGGGVSSSAAIEVATMTALARLWGLRVSPMALAAACQQVENHVVGAPCGVMDQVTSCMGDAGALTEILCQPTSDGMPAVVRGQVPVPAGYCFVGVHSGVRHEVSGDPYTDTRVAAFMGQKILSKLESPDLTRGHLANVEVGRFRRQLRQRLPQRLTGRAFLDQYKASNDTVTTVDPEKTYAVRAAVCHHVFEPKRVEAFIDVLGRAASADADAAAASMTRAGRLMVASHHSYGLRANMGHADTDRLVRMACDLGPDRGFFGAKITGGGCGGTVAILMRNDPQTHDALEDLRSRYSGDTGRTTMLFDGSGPGAAAWGTVTVERRALE